MSERGFIRRRTMRKPPPPDGTFSFKCERWNEPAAAPLDKPLAVQARDSIGPYTLPMRCIRTQSGWISGHTRTPLHVTVIGWRYSEQGVRA